MFVKLTESTKVQNKLNVSSEIFEEPESWLFFGVVVAQRKSLIKQIKSNKKGLGSIPSHPTQRDNIRDTNKALPILYTTLRSEGG